VATGKIGEAARALQRIYTPSEAMRLTRLLELEGVVLMGDQGAPGLLQDPPDPAQTPTPQKPGPPRGAKSPARAPSKRNAGQGNRRGAPRDGSSPSRARSRAGDAQRDPKSSTQEAREESVLEEVQDAIAYLFEGHLPFAAIAMILAFPAIASLCFLIPTSVPFVIRATGVAIPALICLGVLLHFAQRIFEESAEGGEEPPTLLEGVVEGAPRVLFRVVGLVAVTITPAVLAVLLSDSLLTSAGLIVLSLLFLPMACIGVACKKGFEGARVDRILKAIALGFRDYSQLVLAYSLIIAAPLYGIHSVVGMDAALLATIAGPLMVGPILIAARLLGRYFYARRGFLAPALHVELRRENLESLRQAARRFAMQRRQEAQDRVRKEATDLRPWDRHDGKARQRQEAPRKKPRSGEGRRDRQSQKPAAGRSPAGSPRDPRIRESGRRPRLGEGERRHLHTPLRIAKEQRRGKTKT